jgi:rubredoxin-NAD+ reductase
MKPVIIIGTGLAGYQLAREFRKMNQETPLILITADDGRFYSKPLLSTALTNKKDFTSLTTSTAENMAAQLNATLRTHSKVNAIFPDKNSIKIGDEELFYAKLVLACGAEVIKPVIEGNAAQEIVSVNDIHGYANFQELLKNKKRIAILGAGLIGCEFANDLSNAGFDVHVIALGKFPLDLLVPEAVGKLLQDALEQNGVHFHFERTVTHATKNGDSYQLTLSDGSLLSTELALSAIGLRPNISLAKHAGISTNRGIMVNRYLETSHENIFALGDCAEVEGHVLPYITPLLNASRALAKTLANEKTAVDYPAMPVIVKTPVHPIAVCPPPKMMQGHWHIETQENTMRALFYNTQNQLCGFVLTNDAVKERMSLAKQIPGFF